MSTHSYQGLVNERDDDPKSSGVFDIESPINTEKSPINRRWIYIVLLIVFTVLILVLLSARGDLPYIQPDKTSKLELFDDLGRFVLRDFDTAKPMSSFLAGLGGVWGVPMWAFYVNRGQGITSFGIQNKDNAIAKFNTAEKAYQQTPFTGFRTFIKGKRGDKKWNTMPFFPNSGPDNKDVVPTRNMIIGMNEMEVEEINKELDIQTNILYYTIPNEDFPALVRQTTITNTDQSSSLEIEILDGLARLIPSGLSSGVLDAMGRTMEAWMNVYNAGTGAGFQNGVTQPFYHISQGVADTAKVQIIKDGHFVLSFIENNDTVAALPDLLPFVVDPYLVFGTDTTLSYPTLYFSDKAPPLSAFVRQSQGTTSRTPCSFSGYSTTLAPGANITITSVYGHAQDLESFVGYYTPKIIRPGFITKKRQEANELVDKITERVSSNTGSALFDAYVKQAFLDNVLRGGLPIILHDDGINKPIIYHTFSRIHGDIERDYNFFQIDTTYYSQGPGNFRDVNQNRRLDVFHTPKIGTFNIHMFLSFVQADGYNPLTVATTNFKVKASKLDSLIKSFDITIRNDAIDLKLNSILTKPFRIGTLFNDFKSNGIIINGDKNDIVTKIVAASEQVTAGQFAQNGFWADHWTYTYDLIDNYLTIFPDKQEYLFYDSSPVPFYFSPAIIKPREDRYTLIDDPESPNGKSIRVYNAISAAGSSDYPLERTLAAVEIVNDPDYVVDIYGAGAPWQKNLIDKKPFTVSVFVKLLILSVLKFSTLDPLGMGVEMEGGKPGWNDAMNGLPGIVGSGMPETYELLRIIQNLIKVNDASQRSIDIPVEFYDFLITLNEALEQYQLSSKDEAAEFGLWDTSNVAREVYRKKVVAYFSGVYQTVPSSEIGPILQNIVTKVNIGIKRALSTTQTGISPSYFYYESVDHRIVSNLSIPLPPGTQPKVLPVKFKLHTLPIFLEGPVRHMKITSDIDELRNVYNLVKSSGLYDKPLQMFMLSESLEGMAQEIGRMMAFSPGWLENQSVWLHMSYKFYLELLRAHLYDEFFTEIKTGLVPFMDHKRYGRSPLEAASFIVSSAFPDPNLHGAGFLARLSGSTAEFLSMWQIIMAGHNPFQYVNKSLTLKLSPIIPRWLFNQDGELSFTFLGQVKVTYHNPSLTDTWKITPKNAVLVDSFGHSNYDDDAIFDDITANKVRNGEIVAIDVYY